MSLTREPLEPISSDQNETWTDGNSVSENPRPNFQVPKLICAPLRGVSKFKNNVMRKKMRKKLNVQKPLQMMPKF